MLFSRRIDLSLAVTARVGGTVCGAFYFIPFNVPQHSGVMLYALGVLPEYRGRGIGGGLVSFAVEYCRENGLVCLLHPADSGLYGFYERCGFDCRISSKLAVFGGSERDMRIYPLDASGYAERRAKYLSGHPAVLWNENDVGYAVLENAFCGGICVGGDRFCALVSRGNGRAVIRELLTDRCESPAYLKRCALAVGTMCGVSDVSAVFPVWYSAGVPYRSALAFNLPKELKRLFFGLMLD